MAELADVLYGIGTVVEGAVVLAKGLHDPTLPLKVTIRQTGNLQVRLMRTYGSLFVIKGRGYVFGGVMSDGVCLFFPLSHGPYSDMVLSFAAVRLGSLESTHMISIGDNQPYYLLDISDYFI